MEHRWGLRLSIAELVFGASCDGRRLTRKLVTLLEHAAHDHAKVVLVRAPGNRAALLHLERQANAHDAPEADAANVGLAIVDRGNVVSAVECSKAHRRQ